MNQSSEGLERVIGLALVGCSITGVASLVAALFPFFSGEFVGAGVCLLAAAVSLGLLANAVLRE